VAALSESMDGGTIPGHVTVADKLSTHWALKGLFHVKRGVLCTLPQISILCVNWVDVKEGCRQWTVKSAPWECCVAKR
jgi:hypothetical protein